MVGLANWKTKWNQAEATALLGTAFVLLLVSIFFFFTERKNQRDRLTSEVRAVSSSFGARLETQLAHRINAGKMLGLHFVRNGSFDAGVFQQEAKLVHELFGDFQALNWVDSDGVIRVVTPVAGNEAAQGLDLTTLPLPSVALMRAKETRTQQITAPLTLAQGGRGFVAYLPMEQNDVIAGFVNVVFRTAPLMESVLENSQKQMYSFQVLDGETTVFRSDQAASDKVSPLVSEVRVGPRTWTTYVTPTPAALASVSTLVDEAILAFGLLTALLIPTLGTLVARRQRSLHNAERESARLASAVEHLSESLSLWDENDRLVFGNRMFRNLCDDIPDHIVPGSSFEDFLRASLEAGHMPGLNGSDEEFVRNSLLRRNNLEAGRFVIERSDGVILRLHEQNLEGGGIVTIAQDVTEQRRNERALRESEERLALAVRQLTIWDWNLETGKLYMSPGFARSLGYTYTEFEKIKELSVIDIIHPDDVEAYQAKLAQHLQDPTSIFSSEHRFRCRSGEYKWFLARGQAVADTNGVVFRSTGVLTDISERIELENKLHHAQKMEAIGNLTGGVAHDFNNLLAVILGNIELAEEEHPSDEVPGLLREAAKAVQKGADLVTNMLSFAHRSRLQPKIIDLNEIVEDVRSWSSRTLQDSVELQVELADDLWCVEVDPSLAQSALLNLILNGQDAMPRGGHLRVETANREIDQGQKDHEGNPVAPGRYVSLRVSDTGEGIAQEDLGKIFDPFFTRKPPGSGSGLGLSMVLGYVSQSGGFLRVSSKLGTGSQFQLFLRAHKTATSTHPSDGQNETVVLTTRKARILVVEDDPAVLEVLSKTLYGAGYDIVTAPSGDAVLEVLQVDNAFDLVITDVVMPGRLQGMDLTRSLRKIKPHTPVVFLSGFSETPDGSSNDVPFSCRLTKPVSRPALLSAIETSLAGSKL